jgi:threonine/homoserine/homoserine lactone efflux protein
VPPGPIGALCVRRVLHDGIKSGLASAFGALVADVAYGAVAACGAAKFVELHGAPRQALAVVTALVLAFLAAKHMRRVAAGRAASDAAPEPPRTSGLVRAATGTFLLGLGTPGTLPAFVLLFANFGLAEKCAGDPVGPMVVVAGVVAGAAAWWLALCTVVHRFRGPARRWLGGVDLACGVLLLVGAVGAAWSGFAR